MGVARLGVEVTSSLKCDHDHDEQATCDRDYKSELILSESHWLGV